jgi:hypothetical protein
MRIIKLLPVIVLSGMSACSTNLANRQPTRSDTETVMITYHVKTGKEREFRAVLTQAWQVYTQDHLVMSEPHVVVRDTEEGAKVRFVEIFTWVSHDAPDHAPEAVRAIWQQEQSLCEARSGHSGIEGGEVDCVAPTTQ